PSPLSSRSGRAERDPRTVWVNGVVAPALLQPGNVAVLGRLLALRRFRPAAGAMAALAAVAPLDVLERATAPERQPAQLQGRSARDALFGGSSLSLPRRRRGRVSCGFAPGLQAA